MAQVQDPQQKLAQLEELAWGWGKLLAGEVFPDGVGLDVDLFTMEEFAITAAKALVRGAIETMSREQADQLLESAACPQCGKLCSLEQRPRAVQVRGGATAKLTEPAGHCSTCRRDFFPSASGSQDRRPSL